MVKKIYNSPVMDVIELKHQQTLLAGSVTFTDDLGTTEIPGDDALSPEGLFSTDLDVNFEE